MSWTDYTFDEAFLGAERGTVLHRFEVSPNLWHVCYVDGRDEYHQGYYECRGRTFKPIMTRQHRLPEPPLAKCCGHKVPELGVIHANGGHPEHVPHHGLVEGDF